MNLKQRSGVGTMLKYKCEQALELMYEQWLEENCVCDQGIAYHEDFQPCTCMDFDEWYAYKQEEAAESQAI